jgi:hypothetical protein
MGQIRTLGLATAVKGTPTPAVLAAAYYTSANLATPGVVIAVASFTIHNNIATVFLGGSGLPLDGYNGPNGYPTFNATTGSTFDIHGGITGGTAKNAGPAGGQKVTLWGFGTGTYFNGKTVTVLDCDPTTNSFRFYFTHANVSNTADTTGLTAPWMKKNYRAIRLECSQALSTDLIYVGDLNVSSSQYMACLSLAGQLAIEIASENIPPEGICIDTSGTSSSDQVMVTVIY